jgi:putative cobalt transporter subunit CbtA
MSSSTTDATSVELPATDRRAWPGPGWLRIALLAGLTGGLAAAAWNSLLGEPVLGQAIKLEDAATAHLHATAMTEPFTRREQQSGMVLAELLLGCGLGLLIAGAALVSGPRVIGPVRRGWLALVAIGAWSFLVLPAIAYPAMPPGVESSLAIDKRQLSYAALVCSGVLGAVLARFAWLGLDGRVRAVAVPAAFLLPALFAVLLLPHEHAATPIDHGLLVRFRIVAVGSQTVFWGLTAIAGLWLLDHRIGAAVRAARARLAR